MDLQQTRLENIQRLTPHLQALHNGEMESTLESFAKAYLGMYYQLDNSLPPRQRLEQLCSHELAAAIMAGMQRVLQATPAETPAAIGATVVAGAGLGRGYIALAALAEWCGGEPGRVLDLRPDTQSALICYQLAHGSYAWAEWLELLLTQRPQPAVTTLLAFWRPFHRAGREPLPGLTTLLQGQAHPAISGAVSLALLQEWAGCDSATLRRLLQAALATDQGGQLLAIARSRLARLDAADLRHRVYWLTAAYLLAPAEWATPLGNYIGRTKEKVLPLLDYTYTLLQDPAVRVHPGALDLARVLRLIAPIFVRNSGRGGLLDENSTKVLWLFQRLRGYEPGPRQEAVAWLRTVRVMRPYFDILDELERG